MGKRRRFSTVTAQLVWALVSLGACKIPGGQQVHAEVGVPAITPSARAQTTLADSAVASNSVDAGTNNSVSSRLTTPCLSAEGVAAAQRTVGLLSELEQLMSDFRFPPSPSPPEGQISAPNSFQVSWTWDAQWLTRIVNIPAEYGCYYQGLGFVRTFRRGGSHGCWADTGGDQWDDQGASWRIRTPAFSGNPYIVNGQVQQPELGRRIHQRQVYRPEEDQSCIATSVLVDQGAGIVTCLSVQPQPAFQIRVPREVVSPGGILADLPTGQLIRIHGQQILRRGLRWTWDEVPIAGISVAERARPGCALPVAPALSYPVTARLGQPKTFSLVWSSGSDSFIGLRTYLSHNPRRTVGEVTVAVSVAELSPDGTTLTVRWTASTPERSIRFGCSHRREVGGQGLMLQLPDGTRIPPVRAGGPQYRPNVEVDGTCEYRLPQPIAQGTVPAGYKLVFIPADNLPGWWQEDVGGLPRPRAVLEVDLTGGIRREVPVIQAAASAGPVDAGNPQVDAGTSATPPSPARHRGRAHPDRPRSLEEVL